jgi:hypothetical protein
MGQFRAFPQSATLTPLWPEYPKDLPQSSLFILTCQMMKEEARNNTVERSVGIRKFKSHTVIEPNVQACLGCFRSRGFTPEIRKELLAA